MRNQNEVIESARMTYGGQNGGGDAEADGQRGRSFDVFAVVVADAKDDQDQRERREELDAEALRRGQGFVDLRHAQRIVEIARRQSLCYIEEKKGYRIWYLKDLNLNRKWNVIISTINLTK